MVSPSGSARAADDPAAARPHAPGTAAAGHGPPGPVGRLSIERPYPRTTVISVAGDVDLATADVVERAMLDAVAASGGHRVVVDLDRVGFLAARGVGLLATVSRRVAASGGSVRLVADDVTPAARVLHRFPGVGPPVAATVTEALAGAPGAPGTGGRPGAAAAGCAG